jgi:hypothetical protein
MFVDRLGSLNRVERGVSEKSFKRKGAAGSLEWMMDIESTTLTETVDFAKEGRRE